MFTCVPFRRVTVEGSACMGPDRPRKQYSELEKCSIGTGHPGSTRRRSNELHMYHEQRALGENKVYRIRNKIKFVERGRTRWPTRS